MLPTVDYCATRLRFEVRTALLSTRKGRQGCWCCRRHPSQQDRLPVVIGPKVQFVYDELKEDAVKSALPVKVWFPLSNPPRAGVKPTRGFYFHHSKNCCGILG